MESAEAGRWWAVTRVGAGVALLLVPARLAGAWVGPDGHPPAARVLARSLGFRDLALGVGALAELAEGRSARRWFQMMALTDAGDALGTLVGFRHLPPRGRMAALVSALAATAVGARLSRQPH